VLILFDAYVHGSLDRRGFLGKAQKFYHGGRPPSACWRH
jgi:carboxymethylenebutenolidase